MRIKGLMLIGSGNPEVYRACCPSSGEHPRGGQGLCQAKALPWGMPSHCFNGPANVLRQYLTRRRRGAFLTFGTEPPCNSVKGHTSNNKPGNGELEGRLGQQQTFMPGQAI